MILKEVSLIVECTRDGLAGLDISLPSVDYGNVAKAEGNDAPCQNVDDVGAYVPVICARLASSAAASIG